MYESQPDLDFRARILVAADTVYDGYPDCVKVVRCGDNYNFSRNVNLAIAQSEKDEDIFLINDDTEIQSGRFMHCLKTAADKSPKAAMISPRILGGVGNVLQSTADRPTVLPPWGDPLCFVAVLIRRWAYEEIGLLDERFSGHGQEDTDYSWRAWERGMSLEVTPFVTVNHRGPGWRSYGGTSHQRKDHKDRCRLNRDLLREKWPHKRELVEKLP